MAIVDINAQTAQATAQELNAKGVRSIAVTADITKAKECQRYAAAQGYLLAQIVQPCCKVVMLCLPTGRGLAMHTNGLILSLVFPLASRREAGY